MPKFVTIASLLFATIAVGGCTALPEENSGKDAYRHVAQEMPMDEWVVDDISYADGDRTDWKFVNLVQPGKFRVELTADSAETSFTLGVYDRYGMQLGTVKRTETNPIARLNVKAERNGKHYVMVHATDSPNTSYQVRVIVGGEKSGNTNTIPDF